MTDQALQPALSVLQPGELRDTAEELRWAARHLAVAMYTDPQWNLVRAALEQMTSDNSIDGILARQREAMTGISNSLRRDLRHLLPGSSGRPSAAEIEEAETDLRSHLPKIAEQLPDVEGAADKLDADPRKHAAITRIAGIIRKSDISRLSPFGLLIVLWWLFVLAAPGDAANELAVLALWYAIARDSWQKD